MPRKLIIILGPTGSGKTDLSISLAQQCDSPVISCDSRQLYREMRIGTAVPSDEQLAAVRHYFIRDHSVTVPYTAAMYETEALELIERLFAEGHETLVACGGSMFYIDALCGGIPDVPKADPELRASLQARLAECGLEDLRFQLRSLDPRAYEAIDISNPARVLRALEVRLQTGRSITSFKLDTPRQRDFTIEKIGIARPREDLYSRINLRARQMLADGLIDEVRSLTPYRRLPALQTVGYKEVFAALDRGGQIDCEALAAEIALNTRHYAKRQLTWWRRHNDIRWISLDDVIAGASAQII